MFYAEIRLDQNLMGTTSNQSDRVDKSSGLSRIIVLDNNMVVAIGKVMEIMTVDRGSVI